MKTYGNKIALIRNSRGVYCIDSIMGCPSGMSETPGGCYGDCYAARTAKRYGIDFSTAVLRDFEDWPHQQEIASAIHRIKMPFIRLGASGDPSEDWGHTMKILRVLATCNTELVIITRHWRLLADEQLAEMSRMNLCVNTSASALDSRPEIERALAQFIRIKPFCKSVLRVISCDFNLDNSEGAERAQIQDALFQNTPTLDTVFRPSKRNRFVTDGVIHAKPEFFNGKPQLSSKRNRKTYMGKCGSCQEMCGVNLSDGTNYPNRRGVNRQSLLEI